jgi:hypothetical protein
MSAIYAHDLDFRGKFKLSAAVGDFGFIQFLNHFVSRIEYIVFHIRRLSVLLSCWLHHRHSVAHPGFFGMLDLLFQAWDPLETHFGFIVRSNEECLPKIFVIGVCHQKNEKCSAPSPTGFGQIVKFPKFYLLIVIYVDIHRQILNFVQKYISVEQL